ncbi:GNAT superfamily N-acetyltransferase [Nocardia sp. GAS34]|uniref:GNAT family N-acetyltransferase n=1 Tax=unclassified Nocardia TaxID=2637762 RepID=UPI003D24FD42
MITRSEIRRAIATDAGRIAELIAAAFHSLEVAAWLVPDPGERTGVLPANFSIGVDQALADGEIHLLEDESGELVATAVWLPQAAGPTSPPGEYDSRLAAACGPYTRRFQVLDQRFADSHPHAVPHHYLVYLATRPDRQGRGLGTALLRYHHSYLDSHRLPAFLDASDPMSRTLYERHGYRCLGAPFRLPDGPPMWPMWREPKSIGSGP